MYKLLNKDSISYFVCEELERIPFVKHLYTSRLGGVSRYNGDEALGYGGLNLGFSTEDDKGKVKGNYELLCTSLGIDIEDLVLSNQIHEDIIYKATGKDRGKGILYDTDIKGVDGLITNERNVALTLFSADCILIMAVDTRNKAIGACHAGWKGTVKAITSKLIEAMNSEYGTRAEDIVACVCPGIGPCCFEVSKEVINQFAKTFSNINDIIVSCYIKDGEEKYKLDLWKANKELLLQSGVLARNIHIIDVCTCCNSSLFYSYRRDGRYTGRMAAVIELT